MNIPESWLERVRGHDASGWLGAFCRDRKAAVSELLWNRFYHGPLNVLGRGHVLAGWLEAVGDDHGFAGMLDEACSEWVRLNWGRFDEDGVRQGSAWMCAASLVEFSARLGPGSRLGRTAGELRARFAGRETFLGSFSTSPTADPLGVYLAAVAEFHGADRSMAAMWHRMCDLPDGVPPYHARYAMLGLRRLPAADPVEAGTLRAEVVRGPVRLAMGFDRLVRERGMPEALAQATFGPVISQVGALQGSAACRGVDATWHGPWVGWAIGWRQRGRGGGTVGAVATLMKRGGLTVVEHPLLGRSLTCLRDRGTPVPEFRRNLLQCGRLLAFEATRGLGTRRRTVETPLARAAGVELARRVILVAVLRAGWSLLDPFLELVPDALVGFVGQRRDETTLRPETYLFKVPRDATAEVFVLDPMLATGGSAVSTVTLLRSHGLRRVRFCCLLAAPEGVEALQGAHPGVPIIAGALDARLNAQGFIVPGLGDAGDRCFGT